MPEQHTQPRAKITFDPQADDKFVDLITETLNQSAFIELKPDNVDIHSIEVHEVIDADDNNY